jgi:hypothetical protein
MEDKVSVCRESTDFPLLVKAAMPEPGVTNLSVETI